MPKNKNTNKNKNKKTFVIDWSICGCKGDRVFLTYYSARDQGTKGPRTKGPRTKRPRDQGVDIKHQG